MPDYFPTAFPTKFAPQITFPISPGGTIAPGTVNSTPAGTISGVSGLTNPGYYTNGVVEITSGSLRGSYDIIGTPTSTTLSIVNPLLTTTPFSFIVKTGDIICYPTRPIAYGTKVNSLIFTADSGAEQRRQKGNPKATFDLSYPLLSLPEFQTIRAFFLRVTNTQAFYWTDPVEKTTYLVRFDMDTFTGSQKYHGPKGPYYELQLKMLQTWA